MSAVPVTLLNRDGVAPPAPTPGDTVEGHTVSNGGRMFVELNNTDTVSHTVTVDVPGAIDGQTVADRSYALAAGEVRNVGPWPVNVYGGSLSLTVDSALVELRAFAV